jgi:hypothetical protein
MRRAFLVCRFPALACDLALASRIHGSESAILSAAALACALTAALLVALIT